MKSKSKTIGNILIALVYIFMYAPIAVMIFFSFNQSKSTSVFTGFSLYWYGELFSRGDVIEALRNTLILALSSAVCATIFGTIASVGIYKMKSRRLRNIYDGVVNIPMVIPDIVTGVALMLLFVFVARGLRIREALGFHTLLIAHITFNLPYVILNVSPRLYSMDVDLTNAAMDLGCTELQAFFKVTLPSIFSGVVAGFIMSLTMSLDDFVISYYTSGSSFQTLPLKIFSMTKKTVKPDMYALSTVIFIVILGLMITASIIQMRGDKKSEN